MSREIKFRAWLNGEFKYFDLRNMERFPVDEVTQYTGRKDEDEKEIYEEDIVQIIEQGHNMGFYYENEYVGIVKYDEDYCVFKLELIKFERGGEPIPDEIDGIPISYNDESEMDDYWFNEWIIEADMKILGNTFENPELLEQPND